MYFNCFFFYFQLIFIIASLLENREAVGKSPGIQVSDCHIKKKKKISKLHSVMTGLVWSGEGRKTLAIYHIRSVVWVMREHARVSCTAYLHFPSSACWHTEQLLEFMHQLPAFANMTMSVRRELCSVMVFEVVEQAGTIILHNKQEVKYFL